ncbi:MAG: S41 family peptidase [Paludibacter sp.]|nr:S41 family peptidase [Paludibacter sp.]
MKKLLYLLLIAPMLCSSCIDEPDISPNTNVGNFEALWKIIDTKYCYLNYKNINWDSIHRVYAQQVDSSLNKYEFFDLMGKMLAELKDGHVNLYSEFDRSRYWKWFTDYPPNFSSSLINSPRYLGNNYRSVGGMRYNVISGGNIGYIYYGDFSDRFSDTSVRNIFEYFKDCKGLIIDVRNNGGGYLDLSEQLASYFFKNDTITGYMSYKTGDGHSDFSTPVAVKTPGHKTLQWERPLVVLANRMSYSATNSFVCRIKMAAKATVVGDKTGGGGGLPLSSEIPNGWMVRFSASPMFDADMNHTEWGIDPDLKVNLDSADASKGYDTIIEKAIRLISQ